jgi:hypothetical protein
VPSSRDEAKLGIPSGTTFTNARMAYQQFAQLIQWEEWRAIDLIAKTSLRASLIASILVDLAQWDRGHFDSGNTCGRTPLESGVFRIVAWRVPASSPDKTVKSTKLCYSPVKGWCMRRVVAALLLIASATAPAKAQVFSWINLDRLNRKLHGRVVDFTHNHGADRRIWSPILGRPRDLYVYLPPGHDPSVAYPLILFLHGAVVDEHYFLGPFNLKALDLMMSAGKVPPAIIAAPERNVRWEEPDQLRPFPVG